MAKVLGIDIGGTKTHAVVTNQARTVIAEVKCASASIQSVGVEGSAKALDGLVSALGESAQNIDVVVAGSAGLDTPEVAAKLISLLEKRFPGARITAIHDAQLLLAAGQEDSGCVLIFGTGSCAWAKAPDGTTARAGGWGWVLGDESSGFGIVREAIRAALRDHDQCLPQTLLTENLLRSVGIEEPVDLIDAFYTEPGSGKWARHLPAVMDSYRAPAPSAVGIVNAALDHATEEVALACRRAGITGPIILCGGVAMNVPECSEGLTRRLTEARLTDIRVLHRDPVHGAVDLALQQL